MNNSKQWSAEWFLSSNYQDAPQLYLLNVNLHSNLPNGITQENKDQASSKYGTNIQDIDLTSRQNKKQMQFQQNQRKLEEYKSKARDFSYLNFSQYGSNFIEEESYFKCHNFKQIDDDLQFVCGQVKQQYHLKSDQSFFSSSSSQLNLKQVQKIQDLQSFSFPQIKPRQQIKNHIGLKQTKNVTKNMGKLLFKFIWKYRKMLLQKMQVDKSKWDRFIAKLTLWKKQNNITRQFLVSKWHGSEEDSALFRTISRHFFRIRCLSAILKSNIVLKRVHFQRISRFSLAVEDPSALDSIA